MSIHRSESQSFKRFHLAFIALAIAVGICIWSGVSYMRSAPVQAHIDRGVRFQTQGNAQEAQKEWKQAVMLDPNNSQAWELLGDFYLKEHSFEAARDAFNNVQRVAPNTPDLKARMAIAAYQLEENDKAREFAQGELKTNPNSVAALQVLANVEKDVHPDVRLDALKRVVSLQRQNSAALKDLIEELQSRDAYDQIVPLANRLVELAPNSADSHLQRGIALYTANPESDSLTQAQSELQKTLQIDPDNIEAHRYLGRLFLRRNQPRQAIVEFEKVGKGRPYASAHLMELSQAYRRAGSIKQADELRARFTSLRELNTRWIGLTDQIQRSPNDSSYYFQMVSLLVNRALGGDDSAYHLYSFQLARGKLLSVQDYLDGATRLAPRDPNLPRITKQVDALYNRYLGVAQQAIGSKNYAQANENVARMYLIRPNDYRTVLAMQEVQAAGYDPLPHFDPEAAPDPHKR